jgi:hypothetical protein
MNWKDVIDTNAWSQGHGVPNPAVPAALEEWAIQRPAHGSMARPLAGLA